MARQLLRNKCPWCKRWFNTYDPEKKYDSDDCQWRFEYSGSRPELRAKEPKSKKICLHCGVDSTGDYCSYECRLMGKRVPEVEKKKRGGCYLGYCKFDEDNRRAERRRVFDDNYAMNFIRGKTRDRI